MKKNINLIIDGIAPEKVMYDTDNHSLVVLYPAQREFKKGDILASDDIIASDDILLIFDKYETFNQEKDLFHSLWSNRGIHNRNWTSKYFTYATDEQKAQVHELLRKEGKKWNEETLEIEPIIKFKAGDKVRFKKGLILEVDKRYNGLIYPMEIHNTREDILEVLDDDNFGGVRCFNPKNIDWWSYLPEWLEHVVEGEVKFKRGDIVYHNNMVSIFDTYTNSAYEFHGLYNVLIDGRPWFIGKFSNHGVRIATTFEQQILFNALKEEGKKWNAETLEIEDLDINEIVYNLSSACSYLNKPVPDFKSLLLTISNEDFHKYKAQITLQLIREAWNKFEGFVVDWSDDNQNKYHPILNKDGDVDCVTTAVYKYVSSSCYSFPTKERAIQFGNQFKELFKTALGNNL